MSSNLKTALEAGEVPTDSSQPICSAYAKYPKCKKDYGYSALCVTITSAGTTLACTVREQVSKQGFLKEKRVLSGIFFSLVRVVTTFV